MLFHVGSLCFVLSQELELSSMGGLGFCGGSLVLGSVYRENGALLGFGSRQTT